MYDKLALVLYRILIPENFGHDEVFTIYNIAFLPEKKHKNGTWITHYVGFLKNLRIELYPDRIEIIGSVSRFYYGYNARDLNIGDLINVLKSLCNRFQCEMENLKVKMLEFGFTIPVESKPCEIIEKLIIHKESKVIDLIRKTKLVGRTFTHYNYSFKVYDKGFEQQNERGIKLKGNYLRIEQNFKRKHIPKNITTAGDLIKDEVLIQLFDEFRNQWGYIEKSPFINTSAMSSLECYKYFAKLNPLFWKEERKKNANNAKVGKRRFAQYKKAIGDFSLFGQVEDLFTKKFASLLRSEAGEEFQPTIIGGKGVQIENLV